MSYEKKKRAKIGITPENELNISLGVTENPNTIMREISREQETLWECAYYPTVYPYFVHLHQELIGREYSD